MLGSRGVEVGGDETGPGNTLFQAVSETGDGACGRRRIEDRLWRTGGDVAYVVLEGGGPDETPDVWLQDHLHHVASRRDLAGDPGRHERPGRRPHRVEDQRCEALGRALALRRLLAVGDITVSDGLRARGHEVVAGAHLPGSPLPLAETHLQLVLAQLLDGYAQGVLGAGVDLRSGDPQGIVETQSGGVLVDLARPLGAG